MTETKPSVEELKEEIDDLRRQRDYLAKRGTDAAHQRLLSDQIERNRERLKELYGEEY